MNSLTVVVTLLLAAFMGGEVSSKKVTASLDNILDMDFKLYKVVYSGGRSMPMGDLEGDGISGKGGKMKGLGEVERVGPAGVEADDKSFTLKFDLTMPGLEMHFDKLTGPFGEVEDATLKFGKNKFEKLTDYQIKEDGTCDAEDSVDMVTMADVVLASPGAEDKDVTEWASDKFRKAFKAKFSTHAENLSPQQCKKLHTPYMGSYL